MKEMSLELAWRKVEFGKDYKAKRRVIVKNDETGEDTEYLIHSFSAPC